MSGNGRSGWGPYTFSRAAYDEQRECELQFNVAVALDLSTTFQKGIYTLTASSRPHSPAGRHLGHTVKADWPNGTTVSFEAFLYQTLHKLVRMVEASDADYWLHSAPRTRSG